MSSDGHKRQRRHFLIDKRFQLKYTLIIVLISSIICIALGFFIFRAHVDIREAHQEIYEAKRESSELVALGSLDPDTKKVLSEMLREEDELVRARHEASQVDDRKVLFYLVGFLGLLVLCLTVVGIVATHKIAGPAYSLRRVLHKITDGKLPEGIRLRRRDELQDVADEVHRMVSTLRESEKHDIQSLKACVAVLKDRENAANRINEVIADLDTLVTAKENKLRHDAS